MLIGDGAASRRKKERSVNYWLGQGPNNRSISNLRRFNDGRAKVGEPRRFIRRDKRERVEEGARGLGFPRGVPAGWPLRLGTAVHYFLMSNKAISMCPDQGPRVLTRVISPGSPACATSSSEADPPLLSPPLSILPPLSPHDTPLT